MSETKIFAEEKIGKLLFRFSIPIIFAYLIAELYGIVDTIFIGREVGSFGIAALVLVFPIQRIIYAIASMISIGTSTAFARLNGEEDVKESRNVLMSGFTLSYLVMILIVAAVLLFSDKILLLLGASEAILPLAKQYLSLIIFGSVFLSMTLFISNVMYAVGNSKISVTSTTIGAMVNILINFILVTHLGLGVLGAGISTAISQLAGFIYAYYHYRKIKKKYKIGFGFKLDKRVIQSILLVGVSALIVDADDGLLMAVLNNLLGSTIGDGGIVVLGVVSKVYMFLFIGMIGVAVAMQPIAAYNIGAKNFKRLKEIMKKTTKYAFLTSVAIWAIMFIFAPQLIGIFVTDNAVINESVKAFRIMIAAFPLVSIYYVSIYYFQAMGKAKTSLVISALRQIILMIPISIILVKGFNLGAMGVWLTYPISDFLASLASFMLIRNEGLDLNLKLRKQQLEREKLAKNLILE
ncbi:MATE family efflux transporter [Tissierella creatinini]|nr:MATE family efflux transporter [Tissierella creatinini]TJX67272.1 MATE family efflux transporter [Soehngenia saccharolytica]